MNERRKGWEKRGLVPAASSGESCINRLIDLSIRHTQ